MPVPMAVANKKTQTITKAITTTTGAAATATATAQGLRERYCCRVIALPSMRSYPLRFPQFAAGWHSSRAITAVTDSEVRGSVAGACRAAAWHDVVGLQDPLDDAHGVVQRSLHLVQRVPAASTWRSCQSARVHLRPWWASHLVQRMSAAPHPAAGSRRKAAGADHHCGGGSKAEAG